MGIVFKIFFIVVKMKAIFLDRDGTLNEDFGYIQSFSDFTLIPGTLEALKILLELGYSLFVVTNQSGVARGFFSLEEARELNRQILEYFKNEGAPILDSRICPHHLEGKIAEFTLDCPCRKPKDGMLRSLANSHPIEFEKSFMLGDKISDAQTGIQLGVQGILVNSGNKNYNAEKTNYPVFENLLEFAKHLKAKSWT